MSNERRRVEVAHIVDVDFGALRAADDWDTINRHVGAAGAKLRQRVEADGYRLAAGVHTVEVTPTLLDEDGAYLGPGRTNFRAVGEFEPVTS